jgi:exopolysaccharide biosynthesis polyprenyl glycosylphosphotransferase
MENPLKKYGLIKFVLLFLDLLILVGSFHFAYRSRFHALPEIANPAALWLLLPLIPIWIYLLKEQDLYKHRIYVTRAEQFVRLLKALTIFFLVVLVFELFFRISVFQQSRLMIAYFFLYLTGWNVVVRIAIFSSTYPLFSKIQLFSRKTLIIGTGENSEMVAGGIMADEVSPLTIVGFVNGPDQNRRGMIFSRPILGGWKEIEEITRKEEVDNLIITYGSAEKERFFPVYDLCKKTGLPVVVAEKAFRVVSDRLQNHEYNSVVGLRFENYVHGGLQIGFKRFYDFILSLMALVAVSPVMLMLSFLIKFSSTGPVLFKQKRIGRNGKPFLFYKFRSMRINSDDSIHKEYLRKLIAKGEPAEATDGRMIFKIEKDPRVTWVGRFIRKTSLDELPQLFNVLKGDMSLVGPRPCIPYEYELYREWHKRRLTALPGITGVWQVRGRSAVNFDDMVALDIFYVENWSFWLDLKILFQTVPVILFGRGAL